MSLVVHLNQLSRARLRGAVSLTKPRHPPSGPLANLIPQFLAVTVHGVRATFDAREIGDLRGAHAFGRVAYVPLDEREIGEARRSRCAQVGPNAQLVPLDV